jgi:RNA polymerase sigma-70 factor (ECF subfamily)
VEKRSDIELMRSLQAGDTAQLAVLFERYHLPLFRYLLSLSGNRSLSEDLVQDVFFRVLKYAKTYKPEHSFAVWLYQMARNAYIDTTRKRRVEMPGIDSLDYPSGEPFPEAMLERKQNVTTLRAALKQLPEEKREVLLLSRFHDLRYEEIARILKCEVGTVKVRVFRALKELRQVFCELQGEKVV